MSPNPEDFYVVRRLQLLLKVLNKKLESFVGSDGADWNGLAFMDIDEAKTAAKHLIQLGLLEDAKELSETWVVLHKWAVGPVMDEVLSSTASSDPEVGEIFRELCGKFPSQDELEATSLERSRKTYFAVSYARALLKRLRLVEEALSDGAAIPMGKDADPRGPTKIAQAIVAKQKNPSLTDKEVADKVGCDPSTLSKSSDYKAVRDALATDAARGLIRSRRSRSTDMDEYSDDSER